MNHAPNPNYGPSIILELFVVQFGKLNVATDFSVPIFAICLRKLSIAGRTSMPKTTIYEHHNPPAGKNHIRFARYVGDVLPPSLQTHSSKHGPKSSFKPSSLALNSLHGFPSVFRFEVVAHVRVERVERQVTDDKLSKNYSEPKDSTHTQQSRKLLVRKLHRQTQ